MATNKHRSIESEGIVDRAALLPVAEAIRAYLAAHPLQTDLDWLRRLVAFIDRTEIPHVTHLERIRQAPTSPRGEIPAQLEHSLATIRDAITQAKNAALRMRRIRMKAALDSGIPLREWTQTLTDEQRETCYTWQGMDRRGWPDYLRKRLLPRTGSRPLYLKDQVHELEVDPRVAAAIADEWRARRLAAERAEPAIIAAQFLPMRFEPPDLSASAISAWNAYMNLDEERDIKIAAHEAASSPDLVRLVGAWKCLRSVRVHSGSEWIDLWRYCSDHVRHALHHIVLGAMDAVCRERIATAHPEIRDAIMVRSFEAAVCAALIEIEAPA